MTRRYAFVGCGKAKNDGELPAREKYASTYFQKKAEWAESYCDEWWILSAKYGAIEPDEIIDDYDVTISDLDHKERAAFFRSASGALRVGHVERIEGQLFVLAGKNYIEALGPLLEPASWENYEVILPFEGTEGIGEQLAWLTDQLESGEFDTWEPETTDRPKTEQTTLISDGGRPHRIRRVTTADVEINIWPLEGGETDKSWHLLGTNEPGSIKCRCGETFNSEPEAREHLETYTTDKAREAGR